MTTTLYSLDKFEGQTLKDNEEYVYRHLNLSGKSNAFVFIAEEHGVIFYPIGCGIINDSKVTYFIEDDYFELKEQLVNALEEQNYDSTI